MNLLSIVCPNCSAPVEIEDGVSNTTCTYCKSSLSFSSSQRGKKKKVQSVLSPLEMNLEKLRNERDVWLGSLETGRYHGQQLHQIEVMSWEFKNGDILSGRATRVFAITGGAFGLLGMIADWTWPYYVMTFFLLFAALFEYARKNPTPPEPPEDYLDLCTDPEFYRNAKKRIDELNVEIARLESEVRDTRQKQ